MLQPIFNTFTCIALLIVCSTAAFTAPSIPADLGIRLTAPEGLTPIQDPSAVYRFGGSLLAGWNMPTRSGTAAIYVIASRFSGRVEMDEVVQSFTGFLSEKKLPAERFDNFYVIGQPGSKFVFQGAGNGLALEDFGESFKGSIQTYMEIVFILAPTHRDDVTEVLQYVLACPEDTRDEVLPFFRFVIHRSSKLHNSEDNSNHKSRSSKNNSSVKPGLVETQRNSADSIKTLLSRKSDMVQSIVDSPAPANENVLENEQDPIVRVDIVSIPTLDDLRAMVGSMQPQRGLFGSLYTTPSNVPRAIAVQFLLPHINGATIFWTTPFEEKTDVYVCLWPQLRSAWIIPGNDFRAMAEIDNNTAVVEYHEGLVPFLGRWELLYSSIGDDY